MTNKYWVNLWGGLTMAAMCVALGLDSCSGDEPPASAMAPWAGKSLDTDVARSQVETIGSGKHGYIVFHGGTVDGRSCRSPMGAYGAFRQAWESNRSVRMENVGQTDVVNPWLSNGRNGFRTLAEIVDSAVRPGMSDQEKALALYHQEIAHRYHWNGGDNQEHCDPVKVFNVYGYNTCGNDSICLAGLWQHAGFKVSPARVVGHCASQAFFDGEWHLLDGDMQGLYLRRDNRTIANEDDVVRDHDLIKRAHTQGVLTRDNRAGDEWEAALYIWEGGPRGTRGRDPDHTMSMVLRPGESLTWRWGHLEPPKHRGSKTPRHPETIRNGLWEYRPDFTSNVWRRGAASVEGITGGNDGFAATDGPGTVVWRVACPYVLVGGRLDADASQATFDVSIDGDSWRKAGEGFDELFADAAPAPYSYLIRCRLAPGGALRRLAIINDVQMAPLALPEMVTGENAFVYTDESPDGRSVRITHEWVERSAWHPPGMATSPVYPRDAGTTEGTDIVFRWPAALDPDGDSIADYHFELSEYDDFRWPLSTNFTKLISLTGDQVRPQFSLPYTGLLSPGRTYHWRVRPQDSHGVWGSWSPVWRFTVHGPDHPVDVVMDSDETGVGVLRWRPNPAGAAPVRYRVYGSDEKGFSVSDGSYAVNIGEKDESGLDSNFPANFVTETEATEMVVTGAGLATPNTNRAYYRVVAVDRNGTRSGPSNHVEVRRPFIHSVPETRTRVGASYRYQLESIRSLGDLRARGNLRMAFWDVEGLRFELVGGPDWLAVDPATGVLSGQPDAAGTTEVIVAVTLEKEARELDPNALSWGQEKVIGTSRVVLGTARQQFLLHVTE